MILDEAPSGAGPVDMLRIATAGSVDDGKSSLIGRLLYDSKAILEDQLSAIQNASRQRGADFLELALLTDGLRAEREQNITIDVAYRYFSTPRRKFIIADTPGHVQYTRNMVTGTSTADVSVILVDARKGVLTQSRRHAAISTLLGVRRLVIAVNKMDLVDFAPEVFRAIEQEFREFLGRLGAPPAEFIPISALLGDNVVERSEHMDWYSGPPLLEFLERIHVPRRGTTAFRLPVQYVIRPHQDYRGFAGQIEGGSIQVGDVVEVSRTGISSRVKSIYVAGEVSDRAGAGEAAVIELQDEVDVSRGDLLADAHERPSAAERLEATVCWFSENPLEVGRRYVLLHSGRRVPAIVEAVLHRVDADTLDQVSAAGLEMNDIGHVLVHTASPLSFDPYRENRATGCFVLVDSGANATVGAGMILRAWEQDAAPIARAGQIVWLGEWSDHGASVAEGVRRLGRSVVLLDGELLAGVDGVALSNLAGSLADQGFDVLVARVSPGATLRGHRLNPDQDPLTQTEKLLLPVNGPTFLGDAI